MSTATVVGGRIEPTELTHAVGIRIRSRRLASGMTQVDLAAAVGFQDSSSITFIEQGRSNIKLDKLLLICAALKMSPNDLFGWEEKK